MVSNKRPFCKLNKIQQKRSGFNVIIESDVITHISQISDYSRLIHAYFHIDICFIYLICII